MHTTIKNSVLELMGGEQACGKLAQVFYSKVALDPILKPLFPGKSMRCATEELTAFLIQFLGGDEEKTQHRWWLSLRESHSRFRISEVQRTAWLGHMNEAIQECFSLPELRESWKEFFTIASLYIIRQESSEPKQDELANRWREQLKLDNLVSILKQGLDNESIALSQEFEQRTTVFIGIIYRMMQLGRDDLVDYAVERIQANPLLQRGRYNGRSLMHLAASTGCLPVVLQLLKNGVDPDVTDAMGHSALYSVGNGSGLEFGPEIVRALIQAGARVDHCEGVTRSTALHAAARRGNLATALALLESGASLARRDNKGYTPMDRAQNCRKQEVVKAFADWNAR